MNSYQLLLERLPIFDLFVGRGYRPASEGDNDMENLFSVISVNILLCISLFTAAWWLSVIRRNAGIVDLFWGLGFVTVAWASAFTGDGWIGRKAILVILTTAWGLRLAVHIHLRNHGKPEDFRYRRFRESGGPNFWITSLFKIFLLQAGLLLVIAAPIQYAAAFPTPSGLTVWEILGTALWMTGFIWETLADLQLRAFLAEPENAGKVMKYGLWRYSRHPNYFGEALIWWGVWLVAVAVPGGWASIIGPLLINFLLMRISGVPMLEGGLKERRRGYEAYIRKTSPFFPWPPKSSGKEDDER